MSTEFYSRKKALLIGIVIVGLFVLWFLSPLKPHVASLGV